MAGSSRRDANGQRGQGSPSAGLKLYQARFRAVQCWRSMPAGGAVAVPPAKPVSCR